MMLLSDKHYCIEPDYKEKGECFYCGSRFDIEDLREHKGVMLCKECKTQSCPECNSNLNNFSGNEGMPAGLYCPNCNDVIYDDELNILCFLE